MSVLNTSAGSERPRVLIVLTSLCREGTPIMARELSIQWRELGIETAVLALFDEPKEMASDFDALGVPVYHAHLPRTGRSRYPLMVKSVAEVARRFRPQALLSMPFGWHAFIALGAKLARVPRVAAHVGNFPASFCEPSFWKFQTEVFAGRPTTDRLICCSEYVRKGILEHFPVSSRSTAVVYNGSDVEGISKRAAEARRARQPGPFRVGMVARLEKHKDQDTLIHAAEVLARSRPTELWLVGDGRRRHALEELARACAGVTVKFLGARRDVPELLGQLDAFAFSAKPDEGLGIALVEAMAARVPIVATDVGACREVLSAGELGVLVPHQDVAAMARALDEVASGGAPMMERVERAATAAAARFSRRAMATGYARELDVALPSS